MSFFEKVTEFFSMVKIALSPILVFTIAGFACYFWLEGFLGAFICIALNVLGLMLGVWLAIYVHKKHGAIEFNARIDASPDLDGQSELDKKEKK